MPSTSAKREEKPSSIQQRGLTLVVIINNFIQQIIPNSVNNIKESNCQTNYDDSYLTNLLKTFNTEIIPLKNKTSIEITNKMSELRKNYEDGKYVAFWLIIIGSSIEYGPVAKDNKCINIRQILQSWNAVTISKFLIFFSGPYKGTTHVQHDAIEPVEGASFHDLENHQDHSDTFQQIKNLKAGLQNQILNNLDSKINYFISSIPLWYWREEEIENILWCFIKQLKKVIEESTKLSTFLNNIENDLKTNFRCSDNIIPDIYCGQDYDL